MLAQCNTRVDQSGRELLQHGTQAFPIACYQDDFRKMDVPWHWHEEWEAVVITHGSCLVSAGNQKCFLHAGQGFFVNSGILHGCWDLDATGCMFHSLVFHPRLVGGHPDSIFYQHYVLPLTDPCSPELICLDPDIPWQNAALQAIEGVWQACVQELSGYPFTARNGLSQLVLLLLENLPARTSATSTRDQRNTQRIKTMLSFIHSHYDQELHTDAIAASASLSESECLRCFRTAIHTTPIQYLKQYRIQQAARLLTESDDKIQDIAGRCGFQDMSYFTKSFRERLGCTPSEYRKAASL